MPLKPLALLLKPHIYCICICVLCICICICVFVYLYLCICFYIRQGDGSPAEKAENGLLRRLSQVFKINHPQNHRSTVAAILKIWNFNFFTLSRDLSRFQSEIIFLVSVLFRAGQAWVAVIIGADRGSLDKFCDLTWQIVIYTIQGVSFVFWWDQVLT